MKLWNPYGVPSTVANHSAAAVSLNAYLHSSFNGNHVTWKPAFFAHCTQVVNKFF